MINNREVAAQLAEASSINIPGACQAWTRQKFNAPSAGDQDRDGDADAVDGWKSEPVSARHSDRHPPRGVPVSWSGGSKGHGHRAVSLGNGKIRTSDGAGSGRVATRDLSWPETQWGLHYLGWSDTIDGLTIPVPPRPKMTRGARIDKSIHMLTKAKNSTKSRRRRLLINAALTSLKQIKRVPKK